MYLYSPALQILHYGFPALRSLGLLTNFIRLFTRYSNLRVLFRAPVLRFRSVYPPRKSHILFPDVCLRYFEQRLFAPDLHFESLHRLDPHELIDLHIRVRFDRFSFSLVPRSMHRTRVRAFDRFRRRHYLSPRWWSPYKQPWFSLVNHGPKRLQRDTHLVSPVAFLVPRRPIPLHSRPASSSSSTPAHLPTYTLVSSPHNSHKSTTPVRQRNPPFSFYRFNNSGTILICQPQDRSRTVCYAPSGHHA
jgi:hypothetical protein